MRDKVVPGARCDIRAAPIASSLQHQPAPQRLLLRPENPGLAHDGETDKRARAGSLQPGLAQKTGTSFGIAHVHSIVMKRRTKEIDLVATISSVMTRD
jgi:hypothetical protein